MSEQESNNVELQEVASAEEISVKDIDDLEKLKTDGADTGKLVNTMLKLAETDEDKAVKIAEEYTSQNSVSDFLDAFRDALVKQKQNKQTDKNKS